jgi:hypothetical protein
LDLNLDLDLDLDLWQKTTAGLFSARVATRKERKDYEEGKGLQNI